MKMVTVQLIEQGSHNDLICNYYYSITLYWGFDHEKTNMKVMGGYDFPGSNSVSLYI